MEHLENRWRQKLVFNLSEYMRFLEQQQIPKIETILDGRKNVDSSLQQRVNQYVVAY